MSYEQRPSQQCTSWQSWLANQCSAPDVEDEFWTSGASNTGCAFTEEMMLASGADPPGYHSIDWSTCSEDTYQLPPYSVSNDASCFYPYLDLPQPAYYEAAPQAYQEPPTGCFSHGALFNHLPDFVPSGYGAYPIPEKVSTPQPYADAASHHSLAEAMSSLSLDAADTSPWTIPQEVYRGNKGNQQVDSDQFPAIAVNVRAEDALRPDVLAEILENPLGTAFEDPNRSRKGKKWTLRVVFPDLPPNTAQQVHEYASGDQRSPAVRIAISRLPHGSHWGTAASVPLMRAAVVEKVASGLYNFMERRAVRQPLQFRGRNVEYGHLQIVKITRPTLASMQPVLEIEPRFRELYLLPTQVAQTSQPVDREGGEAECCGRYAYYTESYADYYGLDFSTSDALV